MNLNFTNEQKLILYNQYEILKVLNPEDEKLYEEFQNILISGYKCLYHKFGGNWDFEEENENIDEEYKLMVNILDMYRHIDMTLRDTTDENVKKLIEEKNFYFKFQGFDANYDVKYGLLSSMKNLDFHSWEEIKNSHGFQPNYIEMLIRYNEIIKKQKDNSEYWDYLPLTHEELNFLILK